MALLLTSRQGREGRKRVIGIQGFRGSGPAVAGSRMRGRFRKAALLRSEPRRLRRSYAGRPQRVGDLALLRSVSVNLAVLRRAPGAGGKDYWGWGLD
jgi:hypothetical protein